MSLSMFTVVKDAARFLPALVHNMRQIADEVVIAVDATQVDDATVQVAHGLGVNAVIMTPTNGTYEAALNVAAAVCTGNWIMYLHDDELMPPEMISELPELMSTPLYNEWVFNRLHVTAMRGPLYTMASSYPLWPDPQVRLRTRKQWQENPCPAAVHGVPPAGRRKQAKSPLWHFKFVVKDYEARRERYEKWTQMPGGANSHFKIFSLPEECCTEVLSVLITSLPPVEAAWLTQGEVVTDGT